MKSGEVVLANLPQADGGLKLRPVLLLKQLPGHNDFLVCGISTQLHQFINDFDELLDERSGSFKHSGLRQASIIRLGFLAVLPGNKIPGKIGKIDSELHWEVVNKAGKLSYEMMATELTNIGNCIPELIKEKIFSKWMPLAQPFFTTILIAIGTTGQGTGLGLSISYNITTKGHEGKLKVENTG